MKFDFKVGQKYMLRDDSVGTVTVVDHNDGNFPIIIETKGGPISVTYEGRYTSRHPHSNDVIKLIEDVKMRNLITMDKKYVDRKGNPVQVLTTSIKNPSYPVVIVETRATDGVEFVKTLTPTGMYFDGDPEPYIVEAKNPWLDVKVDTLIRVMSIPRYFCKYEENTDQVYFYASGATSKTATSVQAELSKKCQIVAE